MLKEGKEGSAMSKEPYTWWMPIIIDGWEVIISGDSMIDGGSGMIEGGSSTEI